MTVLRLKNMLRGMKINAEGISIGEVPRCGVCLPTVGWGIERRNLKRFGKATAKLRFFPAEPLLPDYLRA